MAVDDFKYKASNKPKKRKNNEEKKKKVDVEGGEPAGKKAKSKGAICCGMCCSFLDAAGRVKLNSYYFTAAFWWSLSGLLSAIGVSTMADKDATLGTLCPISANMYIVASCCFFNALVSTCVGWGYVYLEGLSTDSFDSMTLLLTSVGFVVRVLPTVCRVLHILNFAQLFMVMIQMLVLPECNNSGLQVVILIVGIIWWIETALGWLAKSRVRVPPYLYAPVKEGSGILQEIYVMMRCMGP
eukprot:Platyproteum_vivax@DN8949_c0_g1_i1.p1